VNETEYTEFYKSTFRVRVYLTRLQDLPNIFQKDCIYFCLCPSLSLIVTKFCAQFQLYSL